MPVTTQNKESKVLLFFLTSLTLFPYFPSSIPSGLGTKLAFAYSTAFSVLYLLSIKNTIKIKSSLFFLSFLYAMALTTLVTVATILSGESSFLDIIEILIPLSILASFLFIHVLLRQVENKIIFIKYYMALSLIICAIAFFELYGGNIGKTLSYMIYKREYKEIIYDKATGVFGVTYFLSFFLFYPFLYSTALFFRKWDKKYLLLSLLILLTSVNTQSRAAFITYIFSFIAIALLSFKTNKKNLKKFFLLFVPFFAFMTFIIFDNWTELTQKYSYINQGITFILNDNVDISGYGDGSANVRINQIYYALNNIRAGGLIGSGIEKNSNIMLESVYALYIYRYGFTGLLLLISLMLYTSVKSYLMSKKEHKYEKSASYLALSVYMVFAGALLFSSAMQDMPKLSVFFYGLIAYAFTHDKGSVRR